MSDAFNACILAVEVIKKAIEAKDSTKIKAATSDLYDRLLAAASDNLSLTKGLRELEAALAESERKNTHLQAKLEDRESYVLRKTPKGFFVYSFEPRGDSKDEPHDLCQRCYDKGIKSVLQPVSGTVVVSCIECKTIYR